MTVRNSVLIQTKYAEDTGQTQYTAPSSVEAVHVDSFVAANRTGGSVTLIVRVVPSGGTPGVEHEVFPSKSLAAGEVYVLPFFSLGPGDFIWVDPGAASSIVIRASGRVITS